MRVFAPFLLLSYQALQFRDRALFQLPDTFLGYAKLVGQALEGTHFAVCPQGESATKNESLSTV
jgi:hypothetical protein